MGSQKTKVLTIRISNEAAVAIELEAERSGKSVKELLEIVGMDISDGRLRCNGDSFVPPDDYLEEIAPECDYERLGFREMREAYAKCNYPDHVVRTNNGMLAAQIRDGGRYSGKRFSDDAC